MKEGIVYCSPATGRLRVMRHGCSIIRKEKIPRSCWKDWLLSGVGFRRNSAPRLNSCRLGQ
jgi:hypothetical protein